MRGKYRPDPYCSMRRARHILFILAVAGMAFSSFQPHKRPNGDMWPAIMAFRELVSSTVRTIRGWRQFRDNLRTPSSGEGVLPEIVLEMIHLLRQRGVTTYRLSEEFSRANDGELYQRMIEGVWPRRYRSTADAVLMPINALAGYADCQELGRGKGAALVRCP